MKRTDLLLYARRAAMGCVAVLLLAAGFWSSWGTAQHVLLAKGREHGTLRVDRCGDQTCTGRYKPEGSLPARGDMTIEKSVAVKKGAQLPVVVKPGSSELVRTGAGGALHAWVPLGGALVLAALVIGGGLRMTRLAWSAAALGGALLVGAFFTL
ncbi:hypothetical protein ABZY19_31380 [Streptomyces sp. NPDC006475]|uniref:hypothetical protein n=1 Tax=unclassified Streptomyces TaxID=2593676 RepID=UPI0033A9E92C|nr:hypothetical protein OG317_15725 [Streptomyces sp. NBC_01167]